MKIRKIRVKLSSELIRYLLVTSTFINIIPKRE